jgi:outer membrane protein OmpA-like peptidoglycan-associated protein
MAASLLGTIEEYLPADIVQRAAAFLGETPANTEKAVQTGVPALLGGLIQQASSSEGAEGVLAMIAKATQSSAGADLAGLLASGASMEQAAETGQSLLGGLFGGKLSAIADLIASSSGIKSSSATNLLSLLTPLILGIVNREATSRGGGTSGLMSLLTSQKSEVMSFLPSGLSSLVTGLGALGAAGGVGLGGLSKAAGAASTSGRPQISDAATRANASIGRAADDVGAAVSNVAARIDAAGAAVGSAANEITSQTTSFAKSGVDSLDEASSSTRSRGWLLPAIVLALVALGAWYFLRGRGADDRTQLDEAAIVTPTAPAAGTAQGTASAAGGPIDAAARDTAAAASAAGDRTKDAATKAAEGTRGGIAKVGAGVSGAASAVVDTSKTAAKRTADVTKDVAGKTADVSKDVARKTVDASKVAASKTASVSKDVASKTADVTKDAARTTADAAKKVGGETKEKVGEAASAVTGAFDRLTGRGGGATTPVTLPDGKTVKLTEGGANYELARYLETTNTSPKTFTFERIHFESGSTKLTRSSRQTLRSLAAILKAYPSTEARLDGYTDDSGASEKNQALSQARAEAVKASLVKSGVAASRLATAGNGANNPVAPNDTPEGRKQNRRIELVVTKR